MKITKNISPPTFFELDILSFQEIFLAIFRKIFCEKLQNKKKKKMKKKSCFL